MLSTGYQDLLFCFCSLILHENLYSVSGKGPKWRMKQVFRTFPHSPVTIPLFMLGWITTGIAISKKLLEDEEKQMKCKSTGV